MNRNTSNAFLFFIYKYLFLYLVILLITGVIKEPDGTLIRQHWTTLVPLVVIFLGLQFLTSRYVFSASVTKEGLRLRNDIYVPWTDVASINRIVHVYVLKTKSRRIYIFPASIMPAKSLGFAIEDTHMDQLINLMADKYNL